MSIHRVLGTIAQASTLGVIIRVEGLLEGFNIPTVFQQ